MFFLEVWRRKLSLIGVTLCLNRAEELSSHAIIIFLSCLVFAQSAQVTDGQTDGWTDFDVTIQADRNTFPLRSVELSLYHKMP